MAGNNSRTNIDPSRLRLQDSGALVEGLQRATNPDIRNIAAILKDHRDNTNSLLQVAQGTSQSLAVLAASIPSIPTIPSSSLTTPLQITLALTTTAIASGIATPNDGDGLAVELIQDATGGRLITWGAEFATDTPTDISPAAHKITRFTFFFYGGLWRCHSYFAQP